MTRNNAAKKAIRDRMAITGEPYTVAARQLQKFIRTPIQVIELGEDGDAWFVEGTVSLEEGRKAIKKWLNSIYDSDDIIWLEEALRAMNDSEAQVRYDWFWKPLNTLYPQEEALLKNKTQNLDEYSNEETFTGIYFH